MYVDAHFVHLDVLSLLFCSSSSSWALFLFKTFRHCHIIIDLISPCIFYLFRVSGRALDFGFRATFELMRVTLNQRYHAPYNLLYFHSLVPRNGPRNVRVFDETTNSLSVQWDHADGPVQQYRIIYSPTVGDPIDEYVSSVIPQ